MKLTLLVPLIFTVISHISAVDFLRRFDVVLTTLYTKNDGSDLLTFTAFSRHFQIILQHGSAPLLGDVSLFSSSGHQLVRDLFRSSRFYSARVKGVPYSSGFLTVGLKPGDVYGRLDFFNDTLFIERYNAEKCLVYWESDLDLEGLQNYSGATLPNEKSYQFSYRPVDFFDQFRVKRSSPPVKKNLCKIKLVADYAFFKLIGNGNYANAARYLVNLIERINQIFKPVDWGLTRNGERLTNLGFSIKEMKILDEPERSSKKGDHFNAYGAYNNANAMDLLKSFSKEEGAATCLSILISGKVFDMSILGLANIGHEGERGVCATKPNNGTYMNTAVISVQKKSGLMITRVVDLVVAHEIGHTWGSFHDDVQNPDCVPADSPGGRFIMHESSNSGYDKNNNRFSPCSKQAIHRVLYTVADQCFEADQQSLCGNGIPEPGEDCDPGGQLRLGHADKEDRCCTEKCKFRRNATCSPKHSECCSSTCSYLSSTHMCQAHNNNTCRRSAYCTGNSDKCPPPKPVDDNTECVDEGRCRNGTCISFCHLRSLDWSPCICENVSESCLRCCRSHHGICQTVTPIRYLEEGSICIHGQCSKDHVCVKEVTDAVSHFWRIIKDFRDNPSPKHFADYIVFIVILLSLIIWCPCGIFIAYKDRINRRSRIGMPEENETHVVIGTKRVRSHSQPRSS